MEFTSMKNTMSKRKIPLGLIAEKTLQIKNQ